MVIMNIFISTVKRLRRLWPLKKSQMFLTFLAGHIFSLLRALSLFMNAGTIYSLNETFNRPSWTSRKIKRLLVYPTFLNIT